MIQYFSVPLRILPEHLLYSLKNFVRIPHSGLIFSSYFISSLILHRLYFLISVVPTLVTTADYQILFFNLSQYYRVGEESMSIPSLCIPPIVIISTRVQIVPQLRFNDKRVAFSNIIKCVQIVPQLRFNTVFRCRKYLT